MEFEPPAKHQLPQSVDHSLQIDHKPFPIWSLLFENKYPTDHLSTGKALIFNHFTFSFTSEIEGRREKNERDVFHLKQELTALGFEVIVHEDQKIAEIRDKLDTVEKEDHSERDCLLIIFMTIEKHLDNEAFKKKEIAAHDGYYDYEEVLKPFKVSCNPTLSGKPKIFFVQACRIDDEQKKKQSKFMMSHSDRSISKPNKNFTSDPFLSGTDFLIYYVAVNGFDSLMDSDSEDFIQVFCEELRKNRDRKEELLDLKSLLIQVQRKLVAGNSTFVLSSLSRKLYLKPKNKRLRRKLKN